jgi:small subunit ribosomal protein S4
MARYHGPKCRLCRREGLKLFLKGLKCNTAKCPIEKRSKPPGMHGWHRGRPGDYGIRLREKQKLKRYYGVLEQQFRRYFEKARKRVGNTGESLLVMLERRLDNVLTISGFTVSRAQARQLVTHGHIQVNGRKVDVPNYQLKEGDVVRPEPSDSILEQVRLHREQSAHPQPAWLEVNEADLTARVVRMPVRQDVSVEVAEGLIVEFCSR